VIRAIATHPNPRHVDDLLSVALLSQKYPEAEITFVHPQNEEKLSELREDPSVILVDVGGDYNPELKNYDHHQDPELPFSFRLVLKHEFPEYQRVFEENPLWKREFDFFDLQDRKGFKAAKEAYPDVSTSIIEDSLIKDLAQTTEGLRMIGRAFKRMLDKELENVKALDRIEQVEINGWKVLIDREGIQGGKVFGKYRDAHLLIQVNSFDPNDTSVIKNTSNPETAEIDLSKLKDKAKFVHPAGFIAVLPKPLDETVKEVEQIVSAVAPERETSGRDR